MRTIVSALVIALAFGALAAAQETHKYILTIAQVVNGTEEFSVTKTAQGFAVAGKSHLAAPGDTIDMVSDQLFDKKWAPIRYKLDVNKSGEKQAVTAVRKGDQIEITVSAGGEEKSQSVPFGPRTYLMDNLIVNHLYALLQAVGGKAAGNEKVRIAVPQAMSEPEADFTEVGEEQGTLNGKSITVKKFTLTIGQVALEIWAQKETNTLMRVSVPMQQLEIRHEGFAPGAPTPAK